MNIVSRRVLLITLAILLVIAILAAAVLAAFVYRAIGPIIGAVLGLAVLPGLMRGAREGTMSTATMWILAVPGCVVCFTATIGLDPDELNAVTISWYTCGVLTGIVMGCMSGRRLTPLITVACLLVNVTLWAGPTGVIRLGLAGEILVVVAGLILHQAVRRVTEVARLAASKERAAILWRAELSAFRLERQKRLRLAGRDAAPMLRHIITSGGELDQAARDECRVLEQSLRDEIRGRRLLNGPVRAAILAHRRRGALVMVLDDGGLDDLATAVRDGLLDEVALALGPLTSSRIVIRTGPCGGDTAITIVASTPDETAVALGLDDDDQVELSMVIARPTLAQLS